jgi:tRNA nucleotidyltransferase (CCA-adding enzyme)
MTDQLISPQQWVKALPKAIISLCRHIQDANGEAWLVGGSVRDLCLGQKVKDFDLEIYGLEADNILQLAQRFGHTEQVGKHFGVIKLWAEGMEIDLALPRTEQKSSMGHKGFDVAPNPHLSMQNASLRRDFTINAMMFNPLTHTHLDFHHGLEDLQQHRLRHVSPAFAEDPLRVLRAMQFAARFDLSLAPETAKLCNQLLHEAASLPSSRIWHEWQKWAHASYPAKGLNVLRDTGWLSLYPELQMLMDCPQDPRWHPEGDAWVHTLLVCQQAAMIAKREHLDCDSCEHLMFASLCHDLGKPETTFTDEKGNIRSPNHSEAGFAPTQSFLKRIGAPKRIAHYVHPLVHDHITHLSSEPTARAVRRLAHRLEPASIELWEMLVEADASGRSPAPASRPALSWLEQAHKLSVQETKTPPLLTGKILLQHGFHAGKEMGIILNKAYTAQLDGAFDDDISALDWLKQHTDT